MGHRPADERSVHPLFQDLADQLAGGAGAQHEIDRRVVSRKARQQRRQAQCSRRLERPDRQCAARRTVVAGSVHRIHQQPRQLAGIRQQPVPRLGQAHTTAVALEQREADLRLQRLDARGDVGLHSVQLGCRPVHATEPSHRLEHSSDRWHPSTAPTGYLNE